MSNIVANLLRRKRMPSPIDICGGESESGEKWLQAESSDYDSQSPRQPPSSGPSPQSSDFGSHLSVRSSWGNARAGASQANFNRVRDGGDTPTTLSSFELQEGEYDGPDAKLESNLEKDNIVTHGSKLESQRSPFKFPVAAHLWTSKSLRLRPVCLTLREALLSSGTPVFPQFNHSLLARNTDAESLILFGGSIRLSIQKGMRIDEHGKVTDERGVALDGRGLIDEVGSEYTVKHYLVKTNNVYAASSQDLSAMLLPTTGKEPSPRCGQICAMYGNSLFVWGGDTRVGSPLYWNLDEQLYLLNLANNEWTCVETKRRRPSGRYGHAAAVTGTKLYVFGGQANDHGVLDDLWCIDLALTGLRDSDRPHIPSWERISPSGRKPPGRTGHTLVSCSDRIVLFGGSDLTKTFDDTWVFNAGECRWTRASLLNRRKGGIIPLPRRDHAAAVVDDVMYIYGGKGRDSNFLNDLSFFKISDQQWYSAQLPVDGEAPGVRANLSMASLGTRLVLFGGEQPPSETPNPLTMHLLEAAHIPTVTQSRRLRAFSESASQRPAVFALANNQLRSGWQEARARKPKSYSGTTNTLNSSVRASFENGADTSRALQDIAVRPTQVEQEIKIKIVDEVQDVNEMPIGRSQDPYATEQSLDRLLQRLSNSGLDLTGKIEQRGSNVRKLGGHADIYLGHCSLDDKRVAVKRLRFDLRSDFSVAKKIAREIRVWFKLRHINILPLKGFITQGSRYPALITEWMDNGTVVEYVKNNPSADKVLLIEGIANGLNYLHKEEVVHADLKCANILVSIGGIPLLMDFGISHILHATSTNETATRSEKGTIRWMSPELLIYENEEGKDGIHTNISDVWAFGMTILELLSEKPPFSYLKTDGQVMLALYQDKLPQIPDGLNSWKRGERILWEMCKSHCWLRNPADRPSMSSLVDVLKGIKMACAIN